MKKQIITSDKVKFIPGLPYSQAVRVGQFIYTQGMIADDLNANVATQTKQALEKIKAVLKAGGSSLDNIIKCTVYLDNREDFIAYNDAYREFFKKDPPARSTVIVDFPLEGTRVEIEAVAVVP